MRSRTACALAAVVAITAIAAAHATEAGSGAGAGQPDKPTGQDLLRLMRMAQGQPGAADPSKAMDLGTLLREAQADEQLCNTTCAYSGDGSCDDGGYGSASSLCKFGTDCDDCGPRPKDRACRLPARRALCCASRDSRRCEALRQRSAC